MINVPLTAWEIIWYWTNIVLTLGVFCGVCVRLMAVDRKIRTPAATARWLLFGIAYGGIGVSAIGMLFHQWQDPHIVHWYAIVYRLSLIVLFSVDRRRPCTTSRGFATT